MNVKNKLMNRLINRVLMATTFLVAFSNLCYGQAKSFSKGQQVVIKELNTWYLGKFYELEGTEYWVEVNMVGNNSIQKGTDVHNDIMSLEDAKKQNIAYTDLTRGQAVQPPKTDIPAPPPPPAPAPAGNTAPVAAASGNSVGLNPGNLVFVRVNNTWERGQIVGKGVQGGKATFHVKPLNGNVVTVDNIANIVSAADGMKAGYYSKKYPDMKLSAPSKAYGTTGVACGTFCIITYTGTFTPNAQAPGLSGKPGTVWSGSLTEAIIRITNEARQNPVAVANELDNNIMKYSYDWDQMNDVLDAIAYLRKVKSLGPLKNSDVMSKVNSDYISWYMANGKQPHAGPNNNMPWDRVTPYGGFTVGVGENMGGFIPNIASVSQLSNAQVDAMAREIVYGFIIDAGAANRGTRGHRVTIYDGQKITY